MRHERYVANDQQEMVRLRTNRLRSVALCEGLLREKCEMYGVALDDETIRGKAVGLSSAVDCAMGYWNTQSQNLNAKVLSRYYGLLQMTIAEQVSSVRSDADLSRVQRHTEQGHGLATVQDPDQDFPDSFYIHLVSQGHFRHYLRFLGIDVDNHVSERRMRSVGVDTDRSKLVPVSDLFRRIPELQPVIREYLNEFPMSFHIGAHPPSIFMNRRLPIDGGQQLEHLTVKLHIFNSDVPVDFLNMLNLPIRNLELHHDEATGSSSYIGDFTYPNNGHWHQHLDLYKSNYCGTTYIVPLFNVIHDPIVLNLMLMYGLSILVRYLPELWYRVTMGDLNHIGSLVEYYLSIFDQVMPLKMLERITEKRILIVAPGTPSSPV